MVTSFDLTVIRMLARSVLPFGLSSAADWFPKIFPKFNASLVERMVRTQQPMAVRIRKFSSLPSVLTVLRQVVNLIDAFNFARSSPPYHILKEKWLQHIQCLDFS